MFSLSWLYLIPIGVMVYLGSAGYSFITKFQEQATTIEQLRHEASLKQGTLDSYKRMIDRRDAAIKASKCSAQIKDWVSHPEKIPLPFDPFNQLQPENSRRP